MATATLSNLPNGRKIYFDGNGNPLAGGFVNYYVPGTTTRVNTFSDDAGTVLNSNPVILDAFGTCAVYATGQFREVVTDKNLNTISDSLVNQPNPVSPAMLPFVGASSIAQAEALLLSGNAPLVGPSLTLNGGPINSAGNVQVLGALSTPNVTLVHGGEIFGTDSFGFTRLMTLYDDQNFNTQVIGVGPDGINGRWRILTQDFARELVGVDTNGNLNVAGSATIGPITSPSVNAGLGTTGGISMSNNNLIVPGVATTSTLVATGPTFLSTTSTGVLNTSTITAGGGGINVPGATSTSVSGFVLGTSPFFFTGVVAVGVACPNYIQGGAFIATSDARLKSNDRLITFEEAERFIREVPGRVYQKTTGWEAGFFAQDMVASGFNEILLLGEDENMPEEVNGHKGPAGKAYHVTQGSPDAYIATALASVMDKLDKALARIEELESR